MKQKAQVDQYQQQYKETVAKAKLQAKQAADTTANPKGHFLVPWPFCSGTGSVLCRAR
jgi:hypothetical protein